MSLSSAAQRFRNFGHLDTRTLKHVDSRAHLGIELEQRLKRPGCSGNQAIGIARFIVNQVIDSAGNAIGESPAVLKFLSLGEQGFGFAVCESQRIELLKLKCEQVEPGSAIGVSVKQVLQMRRNILPCDEFRFSVRSFLQQTAVVVQQITLYIAPPE